MNLYRIIYDTVKIVFLLKIDSLLALRSFYFEKVVIKSENKL